MGVLKEWLLRALTAALRKDANVLTLRDLESHALNVAQCDKMLAEALEGEDETARKFRGTRTSANSSRPDCTGSEA